VPPESTGRGGGFSPVRFQRTRVPRVRWNRTGHIVDMSTSSTRHSARPLRHSLVETGIPAVFALALVVFAITGPAIVTAQHGARPVTDPRPASSQADQLWQAVTGPAPVVIPAPEHTGFPWVPQTADRR